MMTSDDLAAVPPGDPKALAATIVASFQQTAVWKYLEAQMVREQVRSRYNERQQELPPPPEMDYDDDSDAGLYDEADGDLFDAGPDDDDLR
jgi:hypothetical protein